LLSTFYDAASREEESAVIAIYLAFTRAGGFMTLDLLGRNPKGLRPSMTLRRCPLSA